MDVKAELKKQIVGALVGASFPIGSPQELLAAFPNGANTTCPLRWLNLDCQTSNASSRGRFTRRGADPDGRRHQWDLREGVSPRGEPRRS